jgi:hypothetical protein
MEMELEKETKKFVKDADVRIESNRIGGGKAGSSNVIRCC